MIVALAVDSRSRTGSTTTTISSSTPTAAITDRRKATTSTAIAPPDSQGTARRQVTTGRQGRTDRHTAAAADAEHGAATATSTDRRRSWRPAAEVAIIDEAMC